MPDELNINELIEPTPRTALSCWEEVKSVARVAEQVKDLRELADKACMSYSRVRRLLQINELEVNLRDQLSTRNQTTEVLLDHFIHRMKLSSPDPHRITTTMAWKMYQQHKNGAQWFAVLAWIYANHTITYPALLAHLNSYT